MTLDPIRKFTPCVNGFSGALGDERSTYACNSIDLAYFLPHALLGSTERIGNDIWGWAHCGREFGLVGQMDGTAFVELVPSHDSGVEVVYLGRLPTQSFTSIWRDIKVIGHYAYIGSEAEEHGIQVFDLLNLRTGPKTFLTSEITGVLPLPEGRSHNIVAHAEKNLIAAVGSTPRNGTCAAGMIFFDVTDPANPIEVGCASEDGYVHDAQCLVYHGPDAKYEGRDVCYAYAEDSLTIWDITDPSASTIISSTPYYGVSYSHQGWVVDEADQSFLLLDDELDELNMRGWAADNHTTTYVWDIRNLEKPILSGYYKSPVKSIDHNLYVVNGLAYESNYKSGLRIVDVSTVSADASGEAFREVGFFDVHPEDDAVGGVVEFGGSWSVYPYFESGYLLLNSMERGLFVLKLNA
ncbi:hypothetical protein CALVIDRAFT_546972 [Calocera viscosa TUFC12733]|uniref:Choice-of-anchor B family protein n=1 Tax=Calocera viscosa (strain TUFC12733) TaxID=1330018 RepID=A0A167IBX4_CALVF|nr:hypothetical protein CALVIDRAFT_546972 [Calocera viscosa TUFC12733]